MIKNSSLGLICNNIIVGTAAHLWHHSSTQHLLSISVDICKQYNSTKSSHKNVNSTSKACSAKFTEKFSILWKCDFFPSVSVSLTEETSLLFIILIFTR